jgi:ABC-2 type transport system permease protein
MSKSKTASSSVPSSSAQVGILIKYTFLDYVRSRRFFILLTIAILVGAVFSFIVGYYRPEIFLFSELTFYGLWWGTTAAYLVVLSGIFFGGEAISGEFQNRTGYFVLPNPVKRSAIYAGKWLAAFVASSIILAAFAAIAVGNGIYYFGLNVPEQFGVSLLFSWLYLASALSFTFLLSSVFKSSSFSILVSAILLLFAFSIIQTFIASLAGIEPWFILTYGSQIIGNVLQFQYPEDSATIPEGLAIMGAYFAATSILGLAVFNRREFT